jgi:WD40 repeat protein
MENNFSENDKEFLKNSLNSFYSKKFICSLILNYLYENKFIESAKFLQNKLGMNEKNIEYNNLITLIKENDFNKIFNFIEQSNFNQIQKEKIIKILKIKKFFCLIQNNFNNNNNNQNETLNYLRNEMSNLLKNKQLNILMNLLFIKNEEEFKNKLKNFENLFDDKIIIENINEILNVNNINNENNNFINNIFNSSNLRLENIFSEYLNINKIYFPQKFYQLKIIDNFSYKNKLNNDEIWDCILSNTKKYFIISIRDGTIILFKIGIKNNKIAIECINKTKAHLKPISFISWSFDDKFIATASYDKTIKIFQNETLKCIKIYKQSKSERVYSAIFISENYVISGGVEKKLTLIDTSNDNIKNIPIENRVLSLLYSEYLNSIIILPSSNTDISFYSLKHNQITSKIQQEEDINYASLSKIDKGKFMLLNTSKINSFISLYDLKEKKPIKKYFGHTQKNATITCVFGGIKEEFILSGSEDSFIYIWMRKYEESPVYKIEGHTGIVNSVFMYSFNKNDINDEENDDGNFNVIVSGSDDHTLRIFCDKNVEVEYKNGLENIEEADDIYDIEMDDLSIFVINDNDNNNNENNNNLMNVDSEHSRENEDDEDNEIF